MSTRSRITVKMKDGTFKSIYCHSDGYPCWNGRILSTHYNNQERAEALVALGDLSLLHESIDCPPGHSFDKCVEGFTVAYGRDRGDKNTNARSGDSYGAVCSTGGWEEYFYYWDGKLWRWNEHGGVMPGSPESLTNGAADE